MYIPEEAEGRKTLRHAGEASGREKHNVSLDGSADQCIARSAALAAATENRTRTRCWR